MTSTTSIVRNLKHIIESKQEYRLELIKCIEKAEWIPPYSDTAISNLDGFYEYLDKMLVTTPADSTFSDLFHGIYFIISQGSNKFQKDPNFAEFKNWMVLYTQQFGAFLNSPQSSNDLQSFIDDKGFVIENFIVPPGGFNSFNAFFCRNIKPGKRPIGAKTLAYENSAKGLDSNPDEDRNEIHKNMADDKVITVPADSVYKGTWKISETDTISVSKGNTYSIEELLKHTKYADRFKNGIFTHSYLTVLTYHRYHTPVRGTILELKQLSGDVFANVTRDEQGHLGASDGTDYQFSQERGLMVIDSPVGLVACLPIGMDVISSCNFSVDEGDYLNKGDEFGNFLFGGSDMIMLFERNDIDIQVTQEDMLYKMGQVFGKVK
ncbi:phosphatidylserine decarboxylase-related [Shewanella halifaxensis HAW-EB4]|uniref:Phosphatidylserine decarboxylase-related n=1 Tax=Shewanella halifaxensis (strain HAW-EB4) TaxID=458817 RepID=B0TT31_SHEHH|nr:phosphatidylserine decarboxylase [Shewanella halifaxensis]ABZ76592.1 phosphatidylserine decarboxylase-related [Shewanella halifaxensis HAW-EB4]